MSNRIKPIYAWILHAEDDELKHIPEVTRTDTFEPSSTAFHDQGPFSTKIFGRVGSPERDERYGKINLRVRILHPAMYERLVAVKGLYKDIIDGTVTAVFDRDEKDFVRDTGPKSDTGYAFFMKHLRQIEFKKNNSNQRNERIDFINERMDRATMKNLIVIPAGLRDAEIDSNGMTRKDEINDFYTSIISQCGSITLSQDMESPAYDAPRRSLTRKVFELYKYIEDFLGGEKFIAQKVVSRRIHDSTRNVLTSMNTGGAYLGSKNTPPFDSTVMGIHQSATTFAPLVIGWLRTGVLAKIIEAGEGLAPLVNTKTLKMEYVQLDPQTRLRYTSEDGIRGLIHGLSNVENRHQPVMLDGRYLALIYQDATSFRVFDSIDELPSGFDRNNVRGLSLIEMIYLSGYNKWSSRFITVTRYPINNEDSIYPSRLYCKTTGTGLMLRELGYDWTPLEDTDTESYLAVEFPDRTVNVYHDGLSPSPTRLKGLGADQISRSA